MDGWGCDCKLVLEMQVTSAAACMRECKPTYTPSSKTSDSGLADPLSRPYQRHGTGQPAVTASASDRTNGRVTCSLDCLTVCLCF